MRGLSPVAASGGHSSSRCAGLSLLQCLLLRSTGSRRAGSVLVAHGPSCSMACGILPDHGSNPCTLHWQADSQPLRHQGSPNVLLIRILKNHISVILKMVQKFKEINGHSEGSKNNNNNKKTKKPCLFQMDYMGHLFFFFIFNQTCNNYVRRLKESLIYLFPGEPLHAQ